MNSRLLSCFCKGSTLKGNIARKQRSTLKGQKLPLFLPFWVDPFQKGDKRQITFLELSPLKVYILPLTLSSFTPVHIRLQTLQIQMGRDLHCLPFWYLTETHICNNGYDQIWRWKSPFQNSRVKGLNQWVSAIWMKLSKWFLKRTEVSNFS